MRAADLDVRPDRVMLDTNVLLAATDEGRAEHRDALTILNEWAVGGTTLCTSGQILREYLAVATRPAEQNGLGLKPADVVSNVRAIRERTAFLAESQACRQQPVRRDRVVEVAAGLAAADDGGSVRRGRRGHFVDVRDVQRERVRGA